MQEQLAALTSSYRIPPFIYTQAFLVRFLRDLKGAFLSNKDGLAKKYVNLFVSNISMDRGRVTIETNTAALFGAACSAATKKGTAEWLTAVPTVVLN